MNSKVLCFSLLILVCICVVKSQKVSVTVYYESLCPDSRKFFTSQLYPALIPPSNLTERINLTLVPFGKANYTQKDDDYQFFCHHGPFECKGNKIQACALNNIEVPQDGKFNWMTVAFINCLMDQVKEIEIPGLEPEYEFPIANCSQKYGVPSYVNAIENCAQHPTGNQYLAKLGDITNALEPKLQSVPTIVFNGKYSKTDSQDAQANFVKTFCKFITGDKPEECKNGASTVFLSSLLLCIMFIRYLL